jgi:hypothetical protein
MNAEMGGGDDGWGAMTEEPGTKCALHRINDNSPPSHLSNMKLSHVFLSVRLRYRNQLIIDANLVLYPTISMTDSNTWTDKSPR